ncbi:MAG: phosphatidate cytidylyltransferase [Bacteroidota bacterium]
MKSNLAQRALTAIVAVSILIPAIVWSGLGVWLLATVVSLLGIWEFWGIHEVKEPRYRWLALVPAALVWAFVAVETWDLLPLPPEGLLMVSLLTLPLILLRQLFDPKADHPAARTGTLVLGYIYVLIPMYLLFRLSYMDGTGIYNFQIPLGILFLTWVLDVMAYFAGRFLGKHPLFPRISPKKTWEGAIGATVFCFLTAWLFQSWWQPDGYNWFIIAGIISVTSQLGDLVESMFKRQASIKDSGSILPGHGGMLDRFDGMFISLPFIFSYFLM